MSGGKKRAQNSAVRKADDGQGRADRRDAGEASARHHAEFLCIVLLKPHTPSGNPLVPSLSQAPFRSWGYTSEKDKTWPTRHSVIEDDQQ